MTQRFLNYIPLLFEFEGTVFENDPADPGGATKYGIDQRSHPDINIRNLTADQAKQIYWDSYWNKNNIESMPAKYGEIYFDICVNCGSGRAKQLAAISNNDPIRLLNARDLFYIRLAHNRPKSQKFLRGWLNRDNRLREYLNIR